MLSEISEFATRAFLLWMFIAAIIGFIFPTQLATIGQFVPWLLGIVMLGMGMTIKPSDFKLVFKESRSVIIGIILQLTIMPTLAYTIAKIFHLPAELAIGAVLVGCCPGGTSSNVMSYLANVNVALSVVITSVSTLSVPFVTSALIYLFAHEWSHVSFLSMLWSVIQAVLLPIIIGFIPQLAFKKVTREATKILPIISVVAISLTLVAVVGGSKSQTLKTGLLIFIVVTLHNAVGYLLGYVLAHVFKLDRGDKKAVPIEVGIQNSGLAVSLATVHFNPLAAVSGTVFSFVHSISGPILAKYWSKR